MSALETALSARRAAIGSLRALARVRLRDPQGSDSSREAIVAARPARLRVEVLSFFGSVFSLVADDGTITAYDSRENTIYRGQASPQNVWRYTGIDLPVSDLVDVVLGCPPAAASRQAQVVFDHGAGAVRLWRTVDGGAQVVWFDGDLPVVTEQRASDGAVRWRATFGAHRDHGGLPIASRIRLEVPGWQRSLDIELEEIDVNPALDNTVFALQTPPGSKVVYLDRPPE